MQVALPATSAPLQEPTSSSRSKTAIAISPRYEPFALRRPKGLMTFWLVADGRRSLASQSLELHLLRALEQTGCHELRRIQVHVDENQIRLHGKVTCFYHKQLAQEAMRAYADGRRINNQISVD